MVSPKKIVKYAFMCLLVLYFFRSSCYAWSYDEFLEFTSQTVTDLSTSYYNQNAASFYLLRQENIENDILNRGFDVNNYSNFIVRTSYTTSQGYTYYYYSYYFYNYSGFLTNISITNDSLNILGMSGCVFTYRVTDRYSGAYELWNSSSNFSGSLSSSGYPKEGYYGLQTLPVDNYYGWRLENAFEPISVDFIPNGDELSYFTNGLKVNNLTVFYYDQWVNLGTIVNGEDFSFVGSLARISNPSSDYHLYETFNYPDELYITGNMYVDINSYNLISGQFYSLVIGVYKDDKYVTEFNSIYYINGGPSSGEWLVVRSGDCNNGPSNQTNTKNIIDSINDGLDSLFTVDSGDVTEIYNNALTYFPSGDSPTVLYELIFGSLDGNSSGDFIISWDNFDLILTVAGGNVLYSGDFIAGNSINFSQFCRENEKFSLLKVYINAFTQFFFILSFLFVFYKCIIVMLGLSSDFINEELTPDSDDYKRHEIGFIQGGRK